ncbi:ribose-phosphate diphosphokinase [Litorilituus sediminis]|uniref:Ribose-phosphate diphosphokinase n=1 Tax=Litorilituus sediminis TaxID=718192 RepID=A0A4P6P634_9GAMM|nr:ribose-phosphate diphosphokinase [Litorilituus sediminis]QBG34872.1 ribose-phosphate diphosphokinase [Litorilituus sediminis]
MILAFQDYALPAQQLAKQLKLPMSWVKLHKFPDGETKVTLPAKLPEHVIICRTLNQPNEKLIELILTASAAKTLGAKYITLVAPYLCYMRQDIAFSSGEAISQQIIGQLLANYFDEVVTIDPHLHRINQLSQVIPNTKAVSLHATAAMAQYIQTHYSAPFIIGPDIESSQWVQALALPQQWPCSVAEKVRLSDTQVTIKLAKTHEGELSDKEVIIIDDIASTGKTLEQTVKLLLPYTPKSISIMVSHAFFVDEAIDRLKALGVNHICSSDCILHATTRFSVIETIAEYLTAATP